MLKVSEQPTQLYELRYLVWGGGSLPLVIDVRTRMPHVPLLLYAEHITTALRANSVLNYVRDLILFQAWCDSQGIDIEERFMTFKGLTRSEIRGLGQRLLTRKDGSTRRCAYSTYNRRLAAIRSYCEFQMDRYLDRCGREYERYNAGRARKDSLLKRLRQLEVDGPEVQASAKVSLPLSAETLEILESILHPRSELNPFRNETLRIRNYTIFKLALATWARRAELVLLEVLDLNLDANATIKFVRKPSKVLLKRRDGSDLKTRAREIPISDSLRKQVETYLRDSRPMLVAGRLPSSALFVSEKDGARLSARTVNYILERASAVVARVSKGAVRIHPHALRATGATNYRRVYQENANKTGNVATSNDLQDTLTYIGGWSAISRMPRRYTQQAIVDRVQALVRQGANKK